MENISALSHNQKHSNVLLIGNDTQGSDIIKQQLEMTIGTSCHVWDCSDDEQALDLISVQQLIPLHNTDIDAVIMDLTSPNIDYPRERFLKTKANIPDIPIIVLLDRTDYALAHFVMVRGAADTISPWQLSTDEDRLRTVIAACTARELIAKQTLLKDFATAEENKMQNAAAHKISDDRHSAILEYIHERNSIEISKLNREIGILRKDLRHAAITLEEVKNRSYAVLRNVQEKNDVCITGLSDLLHKMPRANVTSLPAG